jgi:hypothetical protein
MVVTASTTVAGPSTPARQAVWVFGPAVDTFMTWCWVPVFLVAHAVSSGTGAAATHRLQQGVMLALLVSFLHQPLTFGLVYGDRRRYPEHRRLFLVAPVVALGIALVAAARGWWIVVPIAALWNLQHTLQQRYGIQRIYAGKSRYGSARLDRAVAYVPMAAVLSAVAAMPATTALVTRAALDPMNARGVGLLVHLRPLASAALVVAVLATVAVLIALVRQERRAGAQANPAKWLYQASSLGLLASIVVDPVAGLIAYVCAHAVEYGVVVDRTAKQRYGSKAPATGAGGAGDAGDGGMLGRVARQRGGRVAFFGAIVLGALALHASVHGVAFNAMVYCVGALHFTYDAVIWKLRKPAVARDFALSGRAGG